MGNPLFNNFGPSGQVPQNPVNNMLGFMNYEEVREDMDAMEIDNNVEDFLSHHGIKGMSWGVQNGPPYPLSAEEHKKVVDKSKVKAAAEKAGSGIKKTAKKTVEVTKKVANKVKEHSEKKKAEEREKLIRNTSAREAARDPSKFSDEELARIGRRSQMQQQMKDLSKTNIQKGLEETGKTLNKVGQKTLENTMTAFNVTALERAFGLTNSFDDLGNQKSFTDQLGENLSRSFKKGNAERQTRFSKGREVEAERVVKDHKSDPIDWDIPSENPNYAWYDPSVKVDWLPAPEKDR